MERINRIIKHRQFIIYLEKIRLLEMDRPYCGHDFQHLLDVARIGYILALEEESPITKEFIYAASLLHDIGRPNEYITGEPHEAGSVRIAKEVLLDCGFGRAEILQITNAIECHRDAVLAEEQPLGWILYRADKLSRGCYRCEMEKGCNWSLEKKNRKLKY